jgi:hypothetical protein
MPKLFLRQTAQIHEHSYRPPQFPLAGLQRGGLPSGIHQLQTTVGNQTTGRILRNLRNSDFGARAYRSSGADIYRLIRLQRQSGSAKGSPVAVDAARKYEQEADHVAAQVMSPSRGVRERNDEGSDSVRESPKLAPTTQRAPTKANGMALDARAVLARVPFGTVQPKLIATGKTADFAADVNRIIATQFEVVVANSGEVTIRSTNAAGPLTRDAEELLKTLRTAISDPKTTAIEFIRGSKPTRPTDKNVIVGNYELSTIDLDDVEAFGFKSSYSEEGDNAAVEFVHEITEQYRKQVHGEDFPTAHKAGYAAQEKVLGATLVHETPMTPTVGTQGQVTSTYRYPDGREADVIVTIDFANGQVVDVKRVIRPAAAKAKK